MRKMLAQTILVCLLTGFGLVAQGEARKVKVVIPNHTMVLLPFYVAKDKGYYGEEGLEVEIILMTGATANLALVAGEVEFSTVPTAALTAALRGAPLMNLFNAFYRPIFWLYSRQDIRDVRGLKGKKVGVGGIGAAMDTILRDVLNGYGLRGGQDVVILGLGVQSNLYAALKSGVVDASMLNIPFNFTAEEAGFRELVSFVRQDLVQLYGSIVARDSLLREDPALVEKFIRGTLKGFLYMRDNRSGTIPILARNINVKDDLAAKIYDLARPAMTHDGTVSKELQKKALELVLKVREEKESSPVEKFFDFSLVRKIHAELEAKRWRPGE